MRVKKAFRSLRFRLAVLSAVLSVGVAALLFYNNVSALNILRDEVCIAAQELLAVSQKRLDDNFSGVSSYLATFVTTQKEDIETLERATPDTTAYHISIERIRRQFTSALPGYAVDSFFYFDDARALYFANSSDIANPVRETLLAQPALAVSENAGQWTVLSAGSDDFLVRSVRISRSTVGAWVKVESALAQVRSDQSTASEVYLVDDNGVFLSKSAPTLTLELWGLSRPDGYTFVRTGGTQHLLVSQRVGFGDFFLVTLIPDVALSRGYQQLTWVIVAASLAALVILSLGATLLRQWVTRPVNQLTAAIRALQSGNFTASLPEQTYEEFEEVNRAFNQATEEIQALKIDMYEERLTKQKIQMQYLQLQIAPHFLINCLNTIYQLTDTGQTELTRVMLRGLSEHLRYTLSTGERVPLDEELRHVENYVELSAIRYPGSIFLYKAYAPEAMEALVIPLLILNFVENTIKYEAGMGKRLEIHISVRMARRAGEPRVEIQIWDTGGGFNEEILVDLQDIPSYMKKYGDRHIGISNVFQRAEILFPDGGIRFSNRLGSGAQIDIDIPYISYWKEGRADESADRG